MLGAAPGQVVVADSTTVLLYKLARAAVDARPGPRREIVLDSDNFPTDRYVLEGIAAERGLVLRWIEADPAAGVTPEQVADAVGPDTALVVFSHVAYRSGYLADARRITRIAHDAGALVALGPVPLGRLGRRSSSTTGASTSPWAAPTSTSTAAPGSPAFGYVAGRAPGRAAAADLGLDGRGATRSRWARATTPPRGMQRVRQRHAADPRDGAAQAASTSSRRPGCAAIRAKSVALTEFAIEVGRRAARPARRRGSRARASARRAAATSTFATRRSATLMDRSGRAA